MDLLLNFQAEWFKKAIAYTDSKSLFVMYREAKRETSRTSVNLIFP